ncbi:hypothetical protein [Aromatoleum buckelii]|uniref:Uncharacterized protein n=1 Tax=Aromatoleum buckelii TaxID=200254 RepID=A0ABX1MWP4_9RHOO|nr:hypothetical protein [Aromatoleum buckelii]
MAGLMAMLAVGAGIPEIPLRLLEHAHATDDVVEGFFPALCAGDMPPAELLALADWPLDAEGIGCRPHPGVLDALAATSDDASRPGTISRLLAEYVLSLDVPPGGPEEGALPGSAPAPIADGADERLPDAAAATSFAVSTPDSYQPEPLAALGEPFPSPAPSTVATVAERGDHDHDLEPVPQALLQGGRPEGEKMLFSGLLVDDDTLGGLRGGFETPGGLMLSFGIERVVLINGVLSSTTTLNVADLSQLAGGVAGTQALPVGTSVGVIQIGANNSFDPAVLASGSFATVIQNSLDNQKIQTVTTINAQANSMDMLRAHRLGESLRNALNSSLLR